MANEPSEFETPSAPNKDMWLFLIVLDVIVLCVLGFLLYNHFSAQVFNPPVALTSSVQTVQEEVPALEEVTVTEQEVITSTPQPQPVLQPQEKPMVSAEVPAPAVVSVAEPQAAPVLVEEEKPAPTPKQSIVVTPVNGSKYRRVTFKWFDPAQQVALVSGFTNRKPQSLKQVGDHWEITLSIAPGTYKFLYIVDGKNTVDPYAEQKDGRSVLVVK